MKKAKILTAAALLSAIILTDTTDAAAEETSQPPVIFTSVSGEMLTGMYSGTVSSEDGTSVIGYNVLYSYKWEPANISGRYITGILYSEVTSTKGFAQTSTMQIRAQAAYYTLNHQRAVIPASLTFVTENGELSEQNTTIEIYSFKMYNCTNNE